MSFQPLSSSRRLRKKGAISAMSCVKGFDLLTFVGIIEGRGRNKGENGVIESIRQRPLRSIASTT